MSESYKCDICGDGLDEDEVVLGFFWHFSIACDYCATEENLARYLEGEDIIPYNGGYIAESHKYQGIQEGWE